ncbi:uncharacterized protein G2W53_035673 [Senna tora]|uniref:RNase H type-1 domain-containing protein n=1 Tax=Senna tora TaxID=362788 RepID=A0A834SQU8_9FABA|nr:uncharacterized protein G2W53_035673 [Senna tora]
MAGKQVLDIGICRRISSGLSTRVFEDRWVPNIKPEDLLSLCSDVSRLNYVNDLFRPSGGWNSELLCELFPNRVVQCILSIPCCRIQGMESLYWSFAPSGTYSKQIWNTPIPGKIKHFVWRACKEILPVCDSLARRGIDISPVCPLCNSEPESVFHALFRCSSLEDFWSRTNLPFVSEAEDGISFFEWIGIGFSFWNEVRLGLRSLPLNRLRQSARDLWFDLSNLVGSRPLMPLSSQPLQAWVAPPMHFYKVNTNASKFCDEVAGAGCVIRGWDGRVLAALARKLPGSASIAILEAEALYLGLELARDLEIHKVLVECDCEWVVNQIRSGVAACSPLETILGNIKSLLSSFSDVSFSWIPREANRVADRLAHLGCSVDSCQVWLENYPSCIADVLALDGCLFS